MVSGNVMRSIRVLITVFALVAMIGSCAQTDTPAANADEISGKEIYQKHCGICHGDDGRKGFAEAKIIPESALNIDERIALITRGKGTMMPYANVLNKEEIKAVAEYTLTLK
jgi:mono/diheme cytochrome c family protein